ncbi:hypothetical protein C8R43DRAFT_1029137 [Mycena crocata]|nr:hypothetical protein C8R43DRAFT_1029137 [Mycena crocata]
MMSSTEFTSQSQFAPYPGGRDPPCDPNDQNFDGSQAPDGAELLADHLANNYGLNDELRSELFAFYDVASQLPPANLKVALIQQATMFQLTQLLTETKELCASTSEAAATIKKLITANAVVTKEQRAEITSATRVVFFQSGTRIDFSNDAIKTDSVPYLEKHKATNGCAIVFQAGNKALHKLFLVEAGRGASYCKSYIRRILIQSLPDGKQNLGYGITSLTSELAKKCLGGTENAKPKHAIWIVILRYFIRHNDALRIAAASDARAGDTGLDADDPDFPAAVAPAKRTHSGIIKIRTTDGQILEAFWRQMTSLFQGANKEHGDNFKTAGWKQFINTAVKEELALYPNDKLALIVDNNPSTIPSTASSSSSSRFSGLSTFVTPARASATPQSDHVNHIPGILNSYNGPRDPLTTPTNFTGLGSSSTSSAFTLPPLPLNMPRRMERDDYHPYPQSRRTLWE